MPADMRNGKEIDFQITVATGKYTYIYYKDGSSEALRYGEPWQDTTGNNLVHALADAAVGLKQAAKELLELNRSATKQLNDMSKALQERAAPRRTGEDLIADIRHNQMLAGEQAVLDNLEALGLAKKIVGKE